MRPIGAADMVREVGPTYPGGLQFIALDQWVMAKCCREQKLSERENPKPVLWELWFFVNF